MVTVEEIAEIKQKIETLKAAKSKAEGVIESIQKRWKEEFGCSGVEEVKEKIKSLTEDIEENNRRINVLLQKIDDAYDWDSI